MKKEEKVFKIIRRKKYEELEQYSLDYSKATKKARKMEIAMFVSFFAATTLFIAVLGRDELNMPEWGTIISSVAGGASITSMLGFTKKFLDSIDNRNELQRKINEVKTDLNNAKVRKIGVKKVSK